MQCTGEIGRKQLSHPHRSELHQLLQYCHEPYLTYNAEGPSAGSYLIPLLLKSFWWFWNYLSSRYFGATFKVPQWERVGVRIVSFSPQGWFLSYTSNNITVAVKLLCKHSSSESLSQDSWYIMSECWPTSWRGGEETPSPCTAQNGEEAVQPPIPTREFSKALQTQSTVIILRLVEKALYQGGKVGSSQPTAATAAPGILWLTLWQASKPRIT